MTNEQESKLKQAAAQIHQDQCAQAINGSIGLAGETKCAVPSLRERISKQRLYAQIESRRADALMELEYLLDKNPELARILDLLEQVKY